MTSCRRLAALALVASFAVAACQGAPENDPVNSSVVVGAVALPVDAYLAPDRATSDILSSALMHATAECMEDRGYVLGPYEIPDKPYPDFYGLVGSVRASQFGYHPVEQ